MEHLKALGLGYAGYVIAFAIWAFVVWLVIRHAVAAALRQEIAVQNDLILKQLAEQTRLLREISTRGRQDSRDVDDDLPPPPAARITKS